MLHGCSCTWPVDITWPRCHDLPPHNGYRWCEISAEGTCMMETGRDRTQDTGHRTHGLKPTATGFGKMAWARSLALQYRWTSILTALTARTACPPFWQVFGHRRRAREKRKIGRGRAEVEGTRCDEGGCVRMLLGDVDMDDPSRRRDLSSTLSRLDEAAPSAVCPLQ
jgi:hypothetical protein